jgi:hypothetical protein
MDIRRIIRDEIRKLIRTSDEDNSLSVDEIDMSVNMSPRAKPGIVRQFPQEKEGGYSLNLSVDDGPHMFPEEDNQDS